ncbi:nucleoside/nucleotide kinase family protein [Rhodococcus oxybenzonivorans]|uniref:Nucleoside/nucleotide kinase family protein n=1 Tax=Rhodococcus oxybenzonivorans TaxID=1990687 RepID=A0A2S2BP86_9NOCA|nr:nucleoside/nucleotide kinase family protein [Rhodococcus oxybenzonivorans]AWK70425.1 nucleoside/nucleotide kinase family protein [Rhodococcus oxybenzonivorans]
MDNHAVAGSADPQELAQRVLGLRVQGQRLIVGVTGPPGTGKSTLVTEVAAALPRRVRTVVVPMDGFHLSNTVLRALGSADRKGAVDTFDDAGFAVLLERLRSRDEDVVYAPDFDHAFGDPVAASIAVPRAVDVVFTEGNYLLAASGAWPRARSVMDEVWYLDTPRELRLARLIDRHRAAGKSGPAAHAWAHGTDEINATMVAETRGRADLIIYSR